MLLKSQIISTLNIKKFKKSSDLAIQKWSGGKKFSPIPESILSGEPLGQPIAQVTQWGGFPVDRDRLSSEVTPQLLQPWTSNGNRYTRVSYEDEKLCFWFKPLPHLDQPYPLSLAVGLVGFREEFFVILPGNSWYLMVDFHSLANHS